MIRTKKIKIIKNTKGNIIKFVNKNQLPLKKFGEIYFSEIKPNTTKDWKYHQNRNQYLTIAGGSVVFFFKKKKNGKIKKILLKYPTKLNSIFIPKKYYYKFECISKKKSIIVNIIDEIVK